MVNLLFVSSVNKSAAVGFDETTPDSGLSTAVFLKGIMITYSTVYSQEEKSLGRAQTVVNIDTMEASFRFTCSALNDPGIKREVFKDREQVETGKPISQKVLSSTASEDLIRFLRYPKANIHLLRFITELTPKDLEILRDQPLHPWSNK